MPLAAQDQASAEQADTNAVLADYDAMLVILRTDYAGWETKTAGDAGDAFGQLEAQARAAIAADPTRFDALARELIGWFEDRHLGIERVAGEATVLPQADPWDGYDLEALRSQSRTIAPAIVAAALAEPDDMVAPWQTFDGNYSLAIIPDPSDPRHLIGVIDETRAQSWAEGQVKFILRPGTDGTHATYYMADHSEREMTAQELGAGDVLKLTDGETVVYLERVGTDNSALKERLFAPQDFSLSRLSEETLLLRLPNFAAENRPVIEALLAEHHDLLTSTPNLVIDARYNNGGSDGSYAELMRYLYTRPIYSIGIEALASERNMNLMEQLLAEYRDNLSPDTISYIENLIAEGRANPGSWVMPTEHGFSITTYPEILPFPKRVGILTEGAGSSGDQFVIDSRSSRKVTTFGKPTAGIIDYSNVVSSALPSGNFEMSWPITRSLRLPDEPFDNVGVQPDIPFGEEIADPIGYVQAWLERQVD
ncbi:MAG: S41 family peptidase [Alteraurantiacibacter sp.]